MDVPPVAFLLPGLGGGGTERVLINCMAAMGARGWPVALVVAGQARTLLADIPGDVEPVWLKPASAWRSRLDAVCAAPLRVPVLYRPLLAAKRPPSQLNYLPGLAAYLRGFRPSLVISGLTSLNISLMLARRLSGAQTRTVVTEHSQLSADIEGSKPSDWRRRGLGRVLRALYEDASAIVAVSAGVADDLAAFASIDRDRIETIYNPVITPSFSCRTLTTPDHPWLQGQGIPVILAAGRFGRQKDFGTLVRAFALLRATRPARLIILGELRARSSLEEAGRLMKLAAELGVSADLDLPGFRLDAPGFMKRATVFALSSRFEGLPTVLIEAMACGTPVVSTDCPSGPAEILEGGRWGELVPIGDAQAMAAALARTLDRPVSAEALKRRAARFSAERAAAAYEQVIELALREQR